MTKFLLTEVKLSRGLVKSFRCFFSFIENPKVLMNTCRDDFWREEKGKAFGCSLNRTRISVERIE